MSFPVHPWKVVERGWQPNTQRFAESLMSLANGYMGLRGNFEEDYYMCLPASLKGRIFFTV